MAPVEISGDVFAALPDVDTEENVPASAGSAMPPGHPEGGDASMCPFAMMMGVADAKKPAGHGNSNSNGMPDSSFLPPVAKEKAADASSKLGNGVTRSSSNGNGGDAASCPFAAMAALLDHPQAGAAGGGEDEESEEVDEFKPLPTHTGHGTLDIPIQCPMSGQIMEQPGAGDHNFGLHGSLAGMGKTSFRSRGSHARSHSEDQKSRGQGTFMGRSAVGSRRSRKKGGRPRVKRTKRLTGYSTWEAQNYIPVIKLSWAKATQSIDGPSLGLAVYEAMFEEAPSLSNMFTKQKEIMGIKFAELLAGLVETVEDPTALYEQLKALAPMHVERGVTKDHLPVMQGSILKILKKQLGNEYTLEVKSAWEWMWTWVSETLLQTMEEVANDQTVITRSWDMALDNYDELELAGLLFDTLFEIAPNLRAVYSKPRQTMSVKFMDMLSTLVSFHGDSGRMDEQISWLGVRHVFYNSKRQHIPVMQEVLLTTMARAVGADDWSEEMEKSWTDLWQQTCNKLFNVMEAAEMHGERVKKLWERVQNKTTMQQFGSALRKALLSGTEWVQSLSNGKGPKPVASAAEADDEEKEKKVQERRGAMGQDTFSDKSDQADNIGGQFWNMLTLLLDLMWQPERQNEKLIVMTTKFFECGIRTQHLDTMGESMLQTMSKILGSDMSKEDAEAWRWFWALTRTTMSRTLDSCEHGHAQLVRDSWEKAKASRPLEELGEHLFQGLATLAPHVIHIFKRPKKIQAMQFVNAVELLVTFNEDPEHFFEELKELTIRHIKVGVKPDYAKPYGKAILRGMEELLGADFDEVTKHAWVCLWEKVSNCVIRALSIGSNLVVVSLIQGDLEKLAEAMECTPRGERFETLTKIEVNGEVSSPLRWAIQDGKITLAKYILDDLLAIRADRHAYYYGRERLFRSHPDIVKLLADEAQALLDSLFDGLLWHSHMVYDGHIRVNYYIREMYGCPDEEENVWDTPLGVLALKGDPHNFTHPVMEKLIQVKWDKFGEVTCMILQGVYLSHVALFFAGFVSLGDACSRPAHVIRYLTAGLSAAGLLTAVGLVASQVRHGLVSRHVLSLTARLPGLRGPLALPVPRFLHNQWNVCRCVSHVLILIATFAPSSKCDGADGGRAEDGSVLEGGLRTASAVTAVLMGLQVLEILVLSKRLSAFAYTMMRLVRELLVNVVVCMVAVFAFSGGLVILRDESFESIDTAMLNLIKLSLGVAGPEVLDEAGGQTTGFVMVFMLVVWVGFLNVLIAQFVFGYNAISAETDAYALMMRAQTCCEMESFLPRWLRVRFFNEMQFDLPLNYDAGDEGPPGGVHVLESASVKQSRHYVPDRVLRFTGEASASDPWPSLEEAGVVVEGEEDQLDNRSTA